MINLILDAASPGMILGILGIGFLVIALVVCLLVAAIVLIVRKIRKYSKKNDRP